VAQLRGIAQARKNLNGFRIALNVIKQDVIKRGIFDFSDDSLGAGLGNACRGMNLALPPIRRSRPAQPHKLALQRCRMPPFRINNIHKRPNCTKGI
jgi:hypothetical protein